MSIRQNKKNSIGNKIKQVFDEKNTFTSAPMTPSDVKRRYSKGRCLDTVFRNGYKYKGMCAVDYRLRVKEICKRNAYQ